MHNAAQQLLASNAQYPIVFNPAQNGQVVGTFTGACNTTTGFNCTPYVDQNGNGVWNTSDPELLNDQAALDALSGGLLYVAATQYFANVRDMFDTANHLMNTVSPIVGFLGVVSSTYNPEFVDSTAFAILPSGLLIDMKGITIGGSYRKNATPANNVAMNNFSNSQFQLMGHIVSSLEHETWQELTGYDAISTVRGIQMALAEPVTPAITLVDGVNNISSTPSNTVPAFYTSLGFSTLAPSGFTYTPYTIFSTEPATWTNSTSGASFDLFPSVVTTTGQTTIYNYAYYPFNPSGSWTGSFSSFSSCESYLINQINGLPAGSYSGTNCGGTAISGTPSQLLSQISSDWTGNVIPNDIGQSYFNFFDIKQGFLPSAMVYRASPPSATAYPSLTVANMRNDFYQTPLANNNSVWVEYKLPSSLVTTPFNYFQVDIRSQYTTSSGFLNSMSFEIHTVGTH